MGKVRDRSRRLRLSSTYVLFAMLASDLLQLPCGRKPLTIPLNAWSVVELWFDQSRLGLTNEHDL